MAKTIEYFRKTTAAIYAGAINLGQAIWGRAKPAPESGCIPTFVETEKGNIHIVGVDRSERSTVPGVPPTMELQRPVTFPDNALVMGEKEKILKGRTPAEVPIAELISLISFFSSYPEEKRAAIIRVVIMNGDEALIDKLAEIAVRPVQ